MNILIVEDDDGVSDVLHVVMRDLQANIKRVERWHQMMEVLAVERYDVVLLDLGLPDSGTEATLENIKPLKMQFPETAICVITGHPSQTEENALAHGADDFIHKNEVLKPMRLVQKIASLVSRFSNSGQKLDNQTKMLKEATHRTIKEMNES